MIPPLEPANGSAPPNDDSLARALRLDLEDEEQRALVGSYAISSALGIAFLLLQQFGPRVERVVEVAGPRSGPVIWTGPNAPPEPSIISRQPKASDRLSPSMRGAAVIASRDDEISDAFGRPGGSSSGALVGDPRGMLRDVAMASGSRDGASGSDAKQVLGYGDGGQGSVVPGRTGLGAGTGGGSGIGGVQGSGAVGRAVVTVRSPEVVAVGPIPDGGGAATALGTFVRGREPELRFCYEEGLRMTPGLAGSVTVAITVGSTGSISGAEVMRRTWTGTGAADAEACMLRVIRGWRFSGAERGAGTYAFPLSFTR